MSAGHWVIHAGNAAFNVDTILTMWLAMGFVIVVSIIATRKISIVPTRLQALFENIVGFFWDMSDTLMGREGRKHIPLIASLFLFIITANLMGQIPWKLYELKHGEFASPTNDINMTAAMAIIVLFYYIGAGLAKKKFKFILHDFSPMSLFMFLIELMEMFTRPLTLALRLFGNIMAGEILISAMLGIFAYILPLPFMFFEVLVACVQALVFAMLTMVYVQTAITEEE